MKVSAAFFINGAYSITWVGGFPIAHEQQHADLVDGVVGRSDIGNQANHMQEFKIVGSMSDFDQNVRAEHYISEDVLGADRFLKIASKGPKTKGKRGKSSSEVDFIPTVHVVTHATDAIDLFWSTWKEGAEAALDKNAYLKWDAVGYNSTYASEALEKACTSSDAIVVTVPYAEGTEDYDKMDDAINKCIFEHQKPVFTTNTDTYHNDDVFAYVGSSNYDMGVKCALSILFPTDNDVISGRKALPGKDETDHAMDIQIYWDAASKLDESLRQRFEGLTTTLKIYKEDDKVVPFLPTGRPSCPCVDRYPDGVSTDDDEGLRVTIDGKIYNYPPQYGLETCSRHDKNMIPSCSGSNPPEFCDKTWCYVDPENCDSVETSIEGEYIWTDYAGQEYPYSYETCGSRNLYLDFIGGSNSDGDTGDGTVIGDDKQTIVLSSNWAPNFNPGNQSVFICGDETFSMPHVPQYGQSPWLQGMSSVSAAATAARGVAKRTQWKAFKGNSAASSSSSSYNGPRNFGSFTICLKNRATYMNVEGAIVQCWDNDNNGFGQEIGTKGETRADGCYTAYYSTGGSWDWAWGNAKRPDIYCRVHYNGKQWRTPERTNHNGNHFVETLVEDIPAPHEATVCVESASFNNEPVSGAHVQCWDNDNNALGTPIGNKGMTGGNGCYTAYYIPELVGDPWQVWGREPDVYCEVKYLGQTWETNRNEGVNLDQQEFRFNTIRRETTFRTKIKEDLSKYGKAIVNIFERFNVQVGDTWDVFGDAEFDNDWIVQHPPVKYIGNASKELPVPQMCNEGNDCNKAFGLKTCTKEADCERKKICPGDPSEELYSCDLSTDGEEFFQRGICQSVSATKTKQSGDGSFAEKLCVGHSDFLYDRMYELIIQATEFVDVTSLDSPNTIGYFGDETKQFGAMFRNAISYLHSTGRAVTIKFMFGSIFSLNENPKKILEELTEGLDLKNTNLRIWAGTYRSGSTSWNHGKIIAVDGKKLFTGGSNFYPDHYLREDPVFDVNIIVSNGPAVGAHKYSAKLWTPLCEWTFGGTGTSHVEGAAVNRNGDVEYVTGNLITTGLWDCPPKYVASKNLYEGKTANGSMVIQAARLGLLASDEGHNQIEDGQKSSDLAMFAMMETAEKSIYFSQQDVLPVILAGMVAGAKASGGFDNCSVKLGCSGMTETTFDDTWRMISGIARAVSRGVEVSILVSAPCAQGAGNPNLSQTSNQFNCPTDGTQGDGFDYWNQVYKKHGSKWPPQRARDQTYAHITKGMSPLGAGSSDSRRPGYGILGYGYGWSLENIGDWIFAYYAINKSSRPKTDGVFMSSTQVADHICKKIKIAHTRLNKNETTYMRGDNSGGQVGNHAKILMVDEEIFYIGSDNTYGGGLAEFGLIIDDATRSKDFADNYWNTLWTEARGVNDTGLVSGRENQTKTDIPPCKWKEE
eukprot:CAMPEP_0194274128 /NCGR_PEP_ID=MMETSP0169-20130528/7286_1 /TAXON_ID=218684 /ORGANISM="Corethron pennatum, Strain L29A3" /LENGTH=1429 /DNA_ID=CAMNT_0039017245 /DNA_START=34 /DNA_END=4320 /DNA_ORIENTATION=-